MSIASAIGHAYAWWGPKCDGFSVIHTKRLQFRK